MGFPNVNVFNRRFQAKISMERFSKQYTMAQKFLDNQVITDSNPYVPFQSGILRMSAITGTELGSGEVVWDSPYARYQYYGKVMVGPPPKEITEIPLTYSQPGTRSFWFEEAKSVNKQKWLAGVRKIAGGI